jgi:mannosyltransferase
MSPDIKRRRSLQLSGAGYTVALLTVAAAILRFIFLDAKSLWLDEGYTAFIATTTFRAFVRELSRGETNMLYYEVLRWWSDLAGTSEISLRLLSVIFATATVPLIYELGAELCDRQVGLLAALLLTVNVACVQFAQQARSYSMVGLLVTLSALLFVRSVKRSSPARCAGYVIVGSLCAYVHLFAVLILPAQWLALFLFRADRKTKLRLTACIAVAGILSVPPIWLAIFRQQGQAGWIPATTTAAVVKVFATFAGLYWGEMGGLGWLLFAIYVAGIGIAVAGASERERPVVGFLLLAVVLPVAILAALSTLQPLFVTRYLLICVPFFVILAAIGIRRIRPRAVMVTISAVAVALSLSQDRSFYFAAPMQDWRGAVNFVAANAKPGDVLIVFPEWDLRPVNYYLGRLARPVDFRVIADRLRNFGATGAESNDQPGELGRFLAARGVSSYKRAWITTDESSKEEPVMRALEAGHQVTGPDLVGVKLVLIQ